MAESNDSIIDSLSSRLAAMESALAGIREDLAAVRREPEQPDRGLLHELDKLNERITAAEQQLRQPNPSPQDFRAEKEKSRRHQLDIDELYRRVKKVETASGTTTNNGTSDQVAIVSLLKTSGSGGTRETACSFIYTMTTPTGTQTSVVPSWVRGENGKRDVATSGFALRRTGETAWTLAIAFEVCDTGGCFTAS